MEEDPYGRDVLTEGTSLQLPSGQLRELIHDGLDVRVELGCSLVPPGEEGSKGLGLPGFLFQEGHDQSGLILLPVLKNRFDLLVLLAVPKFQKKKGKKKILQ